ncbi:hypothetical protein G7Y79_00013g033890 [Physcia stellaris]|nr:hypothetical protein G7Y79_00013g033890 [Physcia stellaris]
MSKIGVFPASGKLGTSIYTHLLTLVDPGNVILILRDPSKVPAKYTQAGVTARKADYSSPETLENAFDGVSHLVLVSYPSIENEYRFEANLMNEKVHRSAITAAQNSNPGISHIFYTSLAFGGDCTPLSSAHVMQAHLATEKYLTSMAYPKKSDGQERQPFSFTAIREAIYSESFPMYTGFFSLDGNGSEVKIPHDGSAPGIAWAKIDDLGEATASLVSQYHSGDPDVVSRYENKVILLSGPRVWTLAETVALMGQFIDRDLRIKELSAEEYTEEKAVKDVLQSHGPGDVPREWVTSFQAIKEGETAVVSEELERLLGREPEGFDETIRRMVKPKKLQ